MLFSELSKLSPAEEEEEDESEESVETESFDSEASLGSVAMPEARSTTEYEFWKGKESFEPSPSASLEESLEEEEEEAEDSMIMEEPPSADSPLRTEISESPSEGTEALTISTAALSGAPALASALPVFAGEVATVSVVVVADSGSFKLETFAASTSSWTTELSGGRRDSDSSRGKAIPYSFVLSSSVNHNPTTLQNHKNVPISGVSVAGI
ncbi:hypothetical protein TYRP_018348 [Tyrophagus putrescentiae]|nr:hypothetical protein TYRP_018348 [Tyrophagus putrescentiae]